MVYPRICALADLLWIPKEIRDYDAFTSRLIDHLKLLSLQKIHYSTAMFDIYTRVFPNGNDGVYLELWSHYPHGKIYYTLDGSEPNLSSEVFTERIPINKSVTIKAALFEDIEQKGNRFIQNYVINKSTGKEVILANQPHEEYNRGGAFSLVDGVTGDLPWIDSEWLGFQGKNLDATIDLGKSETVSKVSVDVLEDQEGKIYLPKKITLMLSDDGKNFHEASSLDYDQVQSMKRNMVMKISPSAARFVRVVAENSDGVNWLFADEITVE
jgi:hexosaminidase